ncbi:MAG TPA: tRNA pseudouridine(55) synthase TruB [Nitrospirae bacterium]|nr:tRNA pseudouridine(55) synthase TruB [Nitrospirota bacterium]HDY99855.1 tRNA pseudouridine(55) synthase TruB [Nitrospirota bacterium]
MDIIISINKPRDITSQDAVTKVKKILKVKKAGHTGTLDPLATGLLLICINRATRLASYFSDLDKEYKAIIKLGETTDTQDAYGKIIEKNDRIEVDKTMIEKTMKSFEGKILQQPPMFSALKHKGKPLYKFAREGIEIERKSREINIRHIELTDIDLPYATFKTLCSKGTYIRTLCDDIGKSLGVGAHLFELQRTAIGPFKIETGLTFEELQLISQGERISKGIYTMDEALSWLPEFKIKETQIRAVIHGNPVRINYGLKLADDLMTAKGIRIKSPGGELLAIGSYSAEKNMIKMDVVFA